MLLISILKKSYIYSQSNSIEYPNLSQNAPPPPAKGGLEKKHGLGGQISKAEGGPFYQGGGGGTEFSEGLGELNAQRGLVSQVLATMFFCKCVISVATLLLIIHDTMYILISLIQQAQFLTQNDHGPIQSYNHKIL